MLRKWTSGHFYGNGRNKDRARQAVWGGAKQGRWGHKESHGQCPGQYSGEVWLQKSPCSAIVLGAQSEKRCEEGQAPRHREQQVLLDLTSVFISPRPLHPGPCPVTFRSMFRGF